MRPRIIISFLLATMMLVQSRIAVQADDPSTPDAPEGLTIIVNNNLADAPDANPGNGVCETAAGNGVCTLRAAIMEANAFTGADTIEIPAGLYTLTRPGGDDTALNGDLDILQDLVITGAGTDHTTLDGNGAVTQDRIFDVAANVIVTMNGLRLQDGQASNSYGGAIQNFGTLNLEKFAITDSQALHSGAIHNTGVLRISNGLIINNTVTGNSGAIGNTGRVEISGALIQNNHAMSNVGGVSNLGGNIDTYIRILNSAITNNHTDFAAGALSAPVGRIDLINSQVSGNTAANGNGGAIWVGGAGVVNVINSTLTGNQATGLGGAIYVSANVQPDPTLHLINLYNVTIAGNKADSDNNSSNGAGGGIFKEAPGIVRMQNTLLANNVREDGVIDTPDDCGGTVTSQGYNLIRTLTDCTIAGVTTGNKTGMDPVLAALADNGGPTWTMALQAGSPAIDAGNPIGCADGSGALLHFEQRGYWRHFDGGSDSARCDMGAFEYSATAPLFTHLPVTFR